MLFVSVAIGCTCFYCSRTHGLLTPPRLLPCPASPPRSPCPGCPETPPPLRRTARPCPPALAARGPALPQPASRPRLLSPAPSAGRPSGARASTSVPRSVHASCVSTPELRSSASRSPCAPAAAHTASVAAPCSRSHQPAGPPGCAAGSHLSERQHAAHGQQQRGDVSVQQREHGVDALAGGSADADRALALARRRDRADGVRGRHGVELVPHGHLAPEADSGSHVTGSAQVRTPAALRAASQRHSPHGKMCSWVIRTSGR